MKFDQNLFEQLQPSIQNFILNLQSNDVEEYNRLTWEEVLFLNQQAVGSEKVPVTYSANDPLVSKALEELKSSDPKYYEKVIENGHITFLQEKDIPVVQLSCNGMCSYSCFPLSGPNQTCTFISSSCSGCGITCPYQMKTNGSSQVYQYSQNNGDPFLPISGVAGCGTASCGMFCSNIENALASGTTTTTPSVGATTTTTTSVPGFNGSSGVVAFSGGCASPGNYVVTATSSKAGYVAGITAYDTSGNVLIAEVASGSTIAMAATTNYVFRVRDTGGDGSNGSDLNFTIVPV